MNYQNVIELNNSKPNHATKEANYLRYLVVYSNMWSEIAVTLYILFLDKIKMSFIKLISQFCFVFYIYLKYVIWSLKYLILIQPVLKMYASRKLFM